MLRHLYFNYLRVTPKLRGGVYNLIFGKIFSKVGKNGKIFGMSRDNFGENISLGDSFWLEKVNRYKGRVYNPNFYIGSDFSCSDNVHISCVYKIRIGSGCLFGSKVYIGDHSHGNVDDYNKQMRPADMPLKNLGEVSIGNNCWLGDNVVILANVSIAAGSIVAANSVVRNFANDKPVVLAGVPAKVIKNI